MTNINVQKLKTTQENFFLVWLTLLQPFVKLRKQEKLILAKFLYFQYELTQSISNKAIVEELLFNPKSRKKIRLELDLNTASFNNALSSLRKKKILIGNKINSKLVPNVDLNNGNIKLLYDIEINETV